MAAWKDEVEKRRAQAIAEPFEFTAQGPHVRVLSGSGNTYLVQADLLGEPCRCDCPDFAQAKLGTCKHLEAVRLFRAGRKSSVTPPPRPSGGGTLAFEPRGGEVLVFDLETQRAFDEVDGRRTELLGLSLAVVYAYGADRFDTYREADVSRLVDRLCAADLVVGYNHRKFDLEVLRPYAAGRAVEGIRCFDLLEDLTGHLGHRVSLDGCARATLGAAKAGHGLQAIAWYREGRFAELEHYCREDVRLTRDLFDHGRSRGYVLVELRERTGASRIGRVAVRWDATGLPPPVALLPSPERSAQGR